MFQGYKAFMWIMKWYASNKMKLIAFYFGDEDVAPCLASIKNAYLKQCAG